MRRQGKTGGAFGFALIFLLHILSVAEGVSRQKVEKETIRKKGKPSVDFSLFEMTKQEALG